MTDTPDMILREEAERMAQDRVTAALREAANAAGIITRNDEAQRVEGFILALIPDTGAAFDRAIAEAEARGMERAAETVAHIDGIGMSKMPGKWREPVLAQAAAIRARTEGKEAPRLDAITCSAFDDGWSAEKTFGSFPRHGARTEGEG